MAKEDGSAIEWLNPLHYCTQEQYTTFLHETCTMFFHGFWARFFFFAFIFLAFWTGVRSRNPTLAAVCLFFSAIIAYSGGLVDWLST
ncbi:MAG: hypothetical protein ABSG48_06485 [Geobacteraceae bacterium]